MKSIKNTTNEVSKKLGTNLAKVVIYDALGKVLSVKDIIPNVYLRAGDTVTITWTVRAVE